MFKKRGKMSETQNENLDQNPTANPTEEQLAQGINTDENRAGIEGLEEFDTEDGDGKIQRELDEMRDKYLRLAAEFDNYKRRTSKERLELTQTAGRDIIQSLLDVVDDSERAEKALESTTDIEQIRQGVMLVFNKLRSTLQARGLKKMDAANLDFDTEMHEAITEVPTGDASQAGKVIDVIVPGYYLNEKLIRHAKVVVGK